MGKTRLDMYRHLNEDDKVKFSITDTVKTVMQLNYGQQRFLSELVEAREASENMKYKDFAIHTQQLRELIEKGWY